MKRRIYRYVVVILCLLMVLQSASVLAEEIQVDQKCSLTLQYTDGEIAFAGEDVHIYRIAEVHEEGTYEKVNPFTEYPVSVANVTSQTQWNEMASTLRGYIQADALPSYCSGKTDDEGTVSFQELDTGLYLVAGMRVETEDAVYTFDDFMICIPHNEAGQYMYDIHAKPKFQKSEPVTEETTYTILKLWEDGGNANRPQSVNVDILKDGQLQETVVLSTENQWKYTFVCPDGKGKWAVAERNVQKGYTVTIMEKEDSFVIVNTFEEPGTLGQPPEIPQTGDTMNLRSWILFACCTGLLILILGIGLWRKEHAHKK